MNIPMAGKYLMGIEHQRRQRLLITDGYNITDGYDMPLLPRHWSSLHRFASRGQTLRSSEL